MATSTTINRRLTPTARRDQIAEAAARVFSSGDPTEFSFDDVAAEAGVSRSLVYKYFHDRAHLLAAAYERDITRLDALLMEATERGVDGASRLRAVIETYLDFATREAPTARSIAAIGMLHHPIIQAACRARIERITAELGVDSRAASVTRGVVALLESAATTAIDDPSVDLEQLKDLLHRFVLGGLVEIADEVGLPLARK